MISVLERRSATVLLLLLFFLIPFQRRFHGFIDHLSRKLLLPDFPLPEFFSRKIHLFVSDFLIIALLLLLVFRFKVAFRELIWEGPSKYLTLLFSVFLLATLTSVSKTYSLHYLRLLEFSLFFLFFSALRSLRTRIDLPKLIHRIAILLVCVACVQCGIGLCQYFSQDSVGLKFLGEQNIKTFCFLSPGRQLLFLGPKMDGTLLCRISGTFSHPNVLGGFLFCAIMASYYLYSLNKRLVIIGALLLQFFALYLTFSRSAALALIVGTAVWLFLQVRRSKKILSLVVVVVCSACLGFVLLYPQLQARGGFMNYNHVAQFADNERMAYTKVAFDMIREHPILGVGFNHFQIETHKREAQYLDRPLYSKVHNIYLLVAAESGLIGGALLLLFIFSVLRGSWGLFRRRGQEWFEEKTFLFTTFLGLLLIGVCDFYFFESPAGSLLFFGIAGLLSAISAAIPVGWMDS